MTDQERSIEVEVEVPGTPEQVWRAIATGPGVSSWFVPHTIEERAGGASTASFGPGVEVPGRVAAWEPPHRFLMDGGDDGGEGLAFEWLVEARDGGTCIVRLVNTGFGTGEHWDEMYDGMTEGWPMFLQNLALHLEHFAGDSAVPMIPGAIWALPRPAGWTALTAALGLVAEVAVGDRVKVSADGAPPLAGTVAAATPWRLSLVVDEPLPGTGIITAERRGDQSAVSVWAYLYGAEAEAVVADHGPRWQAWLEAQGAASDR